LNLKQLGLTNEILSASDSLLKEKLQLGRVALEHKGFYRLYTEKGDVLAEVSGKVRHEASGREDFPAVGDWVVCSIREEGRATIHAVLPRKSKFSRKMAGMTTEEQIVAANIDTVFLVNALNLDFNVRRIERYLLMAWESGANPVIILSKVDLCDDIEDKVQALEAVVFGVPIHVLSAMNHDGIAQLTPYLEDGKTIALLGSSGAGKSTLINTLYGEEIQRVNDIREDDDRGKHTTTHRQLIVLPRGGILIDTPGMRELQLWETSHSLEQSFQDVEALAEECRFRDCKHDGEPGCAVQNAINEGALEAGRLSSYQKLQREIAYLERKNDQRAQLAERVKWKKIAQTNRKYKY
jgi:ribosome biogenesis GTPase